MNAVQDAPVADNDKDQPKEIDLEIDLKDNLGESLETGFDALGKVFEGLVGAIKDAVSPEMMKSLVVSNWLGQVAECLDTLSKSLSTDGTVPAESAGQLSFLKDQLDASVDGSKLEAQKATFQDHLLKSQQAVGNAVTDPETASTTIAHAAGYFKAAATSMVPIQGTSEDSNGE